MNWILSGKLLNTVVNKFEYKPNNKCPLVGPDVSVVVVIEVAVIVFTGHYCSWHQKRIYIEKMLAKQYVEY